MLDGRFTYYLPYECGISECRQPRIELESMFCTFNGCQKANCHAQVFDRKIGEDVYVALACEAYNYQDDGCINVAVSAGNGYLPVFCSLHFR